MDSAIDHRNKQRDNFPIHYEDFEASKAKWSGENDVK
jgi:hypothetical protein